MMGRSLDLAGLRVAIVQFPGSNCDIDCQDALLRHYQIKSQLVWHTSKELQGVDCVILPGGFSYGDYLRSGALASHSPIMGAVKDFAKSGGRVLGICNGFQILVESGILPGALLQNRGLKFICKQVNLKDRQGNILQMPIAHGEGRYYADAATLKSLKDNNQIAYRYVNGVGEISEDVNPNGSLDNIAGIYSDNFRVLGLMPHPERSTDQIMGGSNDGLLVLSQFLMGSNPSH
jgi:phosphoribosylformylglycinamidine synthase subunit PurQ / glutaminase